MVLLYIADEGFSFHEGSFYYTRPNYINTIQFGKYFDKIIYIARNSSYIEGSIQISPESEVYLFDKYDFIGIRKFLRQKKEKYDIALLRNGMNGCIAVNTLYKLKKTIISYIGYDALAYKLSQRSITSVFEGIVWYFLEKNKMSKGTYAHYCSEYLVHRYPSKVKYIVCPNVDITPNEDCLRKKIDKYKNHNKRIVIGMIATLNFYKGIDTAIKSINLLPDYYTLEIVGAGNKDYYFHMAERLNVINRVIFRGYIKDKHGIYSWLENIDIYIQPSLTEGIPRSVIEAMSAACPIIVTKTIGAASWIDKEWHVIPRKYKELSEKIKKMGESKEIMMQQASKNFEKSKIFSTQAREEKMDLYYGNIADRPGK